jgi:tetratricopeptide (TPR) repeat protein
VSGGFGFGYGIPYYATAGPNGVFTYAPPLLFMGPGGLAGIPRFVPVPVVVDRGPVAPAPPPGFGGAAVADQAPNKNTRKDPARAVQLTTMGDRLFRVGNLKKAEERYHQAARLDGDSAAPRLRLAQVALVREQYAEAANRIREAETAQPGWIVTAPDIQSIYAEPADFARHVSRLESYLQIHPDDRDAWLVLGAEFYLSGRTGRAADVFQRLNDPRRRSDAALAAFLDATNQNEAK